MRSAWFTWPSITNFKLKQVTNQLGMSSNPDLFGIPKRPAVKLSQCMRELRVNGSCVLDPKDLQIIDNVSEPKDINLGI